jgi:putative spermidine/putrescine transport system permease protein
MALPAYATTKDKVWYYAFRVICFSIFFFLLAPIVVMIPLSFNAQPFFSFTREMMTLNPDGYSLRWYQDFLGSDSWMRSIRNSFIIGIAATIVATTLGTVAALGLSRSEMPYKGAIMAILISPMIVPLIISAAGMFFFFSQIGISGTYLGVIMAHAALGTPFVIITVTATLVGFDQSLIRAAASARRLAQPHLLQDHHAADPARRDLGRALRLHHVVRRDRHRALRRRPGQRTIPREMWSGIREDISPTILAVATLMVILSVLLLVVIELLRRRSERLRGLTPA